MTVQRFERLLWKYNRKWLIGLNPVKIDVRLTTNDHPLLRRTVVRDHTWIENDSVLHFVPFRQHSITCPCDSCYFPVNINFSELTIPINRQFVKLYKIGIDIFKRRIDIYNPIEIIAVKNKNPEALVDYACKNNICDAEYVRAKVLRIKNEAAMFIYKELMDKYYRPGGTGYYKAKARFEKFCS